MNLGCSALAGQIRRVHDARELEPERRDVGTLDVFRGDSPAIAVGQVETVARVGDEIEPYVESRYPGAARLYRLEPLAVAFSERFNILVPVARTPSQAEEANQILEWVLAVEKVGGVTGFERVTQTAEDWVVAHRGMPLPTRPRRPRVLTAAIFTTGERSAPSFDPQVLRYEAMMDRPGGCVTPGDGLHRSQVLVHTPVDPGAADEAVPRWEPDEELRVNLRRKDAPFVERGPFDDADASAFTPVAATGAAVPWRSDGGVMRPDADPLPAPAQYAVFGAADWHHVQVQVAVDPAGGEAGVAVAVTGSHTIEALLSAAGQLRLVERNGPSLRTLAGPVAAAGAAGRCGGRPGRRAGQRGGGALRLALSPAYGEGIGARAALRPGGGERNRPRRARQPHGGAS